MRREGDAVAVGADGAEVVQPAQGGAISTLFTIAQVVLMAFMVSRFIGGGAGRSSSEDAGNATAAAVPMAPAGVPAVPAVVAGEAPSIWDIMSGKGHKAVDTELISYEQHRRAALAAAPAEKALRNLWPPGSEFSLAIYLSNSAAPITDFAALDGGDGELGGASAAAAAAATSTAAAAAASDSIIAAAAPAPRSWFDFMRAALSSDSNVLSLFDAAPDVEYGNATWEGLETVHFERATEAAAIEGSASENVGVLPDPAPVAPHSAAPLWLERGLRYASGTGSFRRQHINVTLPSPLLRDDPNATVYAHLYFVLTGAHADPASQQYAPASAFHVVHPLTKRLKTKPLKATRNLLSGSSSSGVDSSVTDGSGGAGDDGDAPKQAVFGIGLATPSVAAASGGSGMDSSVEAAASPLATAGLTFWKPTLHVQLVADWSSHPPRAVPPHIAPSILVLPAASGYYPSVHVNEFFLLGADLVELNASVASVPLTVSFSMQHMLAWTMQQQMQMSWKMQEAMGTGREGDNDLLKGVLMQTNPVLLTLTFIISMLHMVFDILAFKNDISFWRSAKSMEGLSLRSIVVNVFFQAVILLYLLDNDTS